MTKQYYLKVPTSQGEKLIPVDPKDIDLTVMTTFYERVYGQVKRAQGVECMINTRLDVGAMLASLEEIRKLTLHGLERFGKSGEKIRRELFEPMDFKPFLEALARGDQHEAAEIFQSLLYAWLGGLSTVAEALHRAETASLHLDAAVHGMSVAIEKSPDLTRQLYFDWADAAETLRQTVQELGVLEGTLRAYEARIGKARSNIHDALDPSLPRISEALEYLDGKKTSFLITAFEHLRNSNPLHAIAADLAKAKRYLEECRDYERRARTTWEELSDVIRRDVLPRQHAMQGLTIKLDSATRRFHEFRRRFPEDAARPFEVQGEMNFIARENYEQAERFLRDPAWSPRTAKSRIEGLFGNVLSFLENVPVFSGEVRDKLEAVERYIRDIEGRRGDGKPPTPGPPPEPEHTAMPKLTPIAPQAVRGERPAVDRKRLDELYELMICVGSVLTCNPHFLAASTVKAMLSVVEYCGRCAAVEAERYRNSLAERMKQAGEVENVSKNVLARWRESESRWIMYRFGRLPVRNGFKLTERSAPYAEKLLRKHDLTVDAIRAAHTRRREDKLQSWKKRKHVSK